MRHSRYALELEYVNPDHAGWGFLSQGYRRPVVNYLVPLSKPAGILCLLLLPRVNLERMSVTSSDLSKADDPYPCFFAVSVCPAVVHISLMSTIK